MKIFLASEPRESRATSRYVSSLNHTSLREEHAENSTFANDVSPRTHVDKYIKLSGFESLENEIKLIESPERGTYGEVVKTHSLKRLFQIWT